MSSDSEKQEHVQLDNANTVDFIVDPDAGLSDEERAKIVRPSPSLNNMVYLFFFDAPRGLNTSAQVCRRIMNQANNSVGAQITLEA